jgi:hypothetical protein
MAPQVAFKWRARRRRRGGGAVGRGAKRAQERDLAGEREGDLTGLSAG